MRIYKKRVPVRTYEDKPCGFETEVRCKRAETGHSNRTMPERYGPRFNQPPCRVGPEAELTLHVDGRKIELLLSMDDCPEVQMIYDMVIGASTQPPKLRFSIIDCDAKEDPTDD